jgi:hypothetical protein
VWSAGLEDKLEGDHPAAAVEVRVRDRIPPEYVTIKSMGANYRDVS